MPQLVEISMELTNACQLSCLHCSSGSAMVAGKNELTYLEHRRLAQEARAMGATVVSLSGGNPLNYKDLMYLISELSFLHYERILLYTTGHNNYGNTVEDYWAITYLASIPQLTWIFSLHSHLPEVNDILMNKPGALEDIKASIRYLRSLNIPVEIHMVPMQPNFLHIASVRELCRELGVSKMSLLRFVPQTRGKANRDKLEMDKEDFATMQAMLDIEANLLDHPVQLRMGCPIDFRHMLGLRETKAKRCHAGDDLMLVRPIGAVHPCAAWKSLPADSNVRDASLKDIWENSEVFQAIRRFKETDYLQVEGCSGCIFIDSCQSGCPAQRLHALPGYNGRDMSGLLDSHSDPLCILGG